MTAPSPRILHLISSLGLYGSERVVLNLCAAMPEGTSGVAVFEKADGGHERLREALMAAGVDCHELPDRQADTGRAIRAVRRLLRDGGYDILHTHGYKPNVLGALIGTISPRTKVICSEHGFTDKSAKSRAYGRLDRLALRLPAVRAVYCASARVRDRCAGAGVNSAKLHHIENAVPRPETVPTPHSARDIDFLFLGRLSHEKGPDILVEALARTRGRATIAGDGPMMSALTERAEALGIGDRITFAGFSDDPAALLGQTRWFVLPSRTEGMPLALLEALAHGTPAIAAPVGGVPTLWDGAAPGILLGAPTDAAVLATAMTRAIDAGTNDWQAMSDAGREVIKTRFGFDAWAAAWRRAYEAAYQGAAR